MCEYVVTAPRSIVSESESQSVSQSVTKSVSQSVTGIKYLLSFEMIYVIVERY